MCVCCLPNEVDAWKAVLTAQALAKSIRKAPGWEETAPDIAMAKASSVPILAAPPIIGQPSPASLGTSLAVAREVASPSEYRPPLLAIKPFLPYYKTGICAQPCSYL